ncbi:MAG TPA: arylsulfatase [Acetobacteraceae bacterium]|nr:arylsulfatase [Acetobacteraceae bacterium]
MLAPLQALAQAVLPKPEAPFHGRIAPTREHAVPAWPEAVKPPAGAPNIVLILLDDVGYGAAGTFGGPAATPELDKLAKDGIRYDDFNTTAICSPTRAALLTGRNHHQVGFGNLQDVPAGFPGYNTVWHKATASIAEILRLHGYSTAAFGKWHNTPIWEISPVGPFDHWPTGLGFEYFYGFMGGESSEWEPRLYRDTVPVEPPGGYLHGYHLTVDLVNDALHWVREHDAVSPDKPFFLYFATGATHAPHHVPKEWIDKYRGKFDQGWDKLREETFARQKKLGVIPADAELTKRPKELPAWDRLSPDQKRLYARQMEVYAGFLAQTDHEVGRLLQGLRYDGKANNTLVIYVVGDNGGSAEGGLDGSDAATALTDGQSNDLATQMRHIDDLGGPYFDNNYAAGWSWATSTPFQWMKQIASHFGGTRDGLVISWPGHVTHPTEVRHQFSHANDIVPTILDAAHIPFPDIVDGVHQTPLAGKSLLATFTDPTAKTGHDEQYFEIFGNRAIYKDGWIACARRYAPWEIYQNPVKIFMTNFDKDRWELYHVATDYSEAHDLAAQMPEKLTTLKAEFDKEAARNDVFPLVPFPIFGAPSPRTGRTHFVYAEGVDRVPPDVVPDLSGRAHRLTAEIDVPVTGAKGVIVAEGGRFGGFSLFVEDGKLIYENNTLGKTHEQIVATIPLPPGQDEIQFEFSPENRLAGLLAMMNRRPPGGDARLLLNGKLAGTAHFDQFGGFTDAINETLDVGQDTGSPVSNDYLAPNPFTGRVRKITIDLQ